MLRASSALLLMPLMMTTLGPERYGLWITISTVTMYLSLSESGLGQTVVNEIGKAYARGRTDRVGQIMATAHAVYWALILVAMAAALIAINTLPIGRLLLSEGDAALYTPTLRGCLSVAAVLALARIPMLVFPGLLMGVRKLPLRVAWEIGGTLAAMAATALVLLLGGGLRSLTLAINATLLIATAAICLSSARCGPWARLRMRNFNPRLVWPLLATSSFFFLISAAGVMDRSLTVLLVPRLDSLGAAPAFFFLTSLFRGAGYSLIAAMPRAIQPYIVSWTTTGETASVARLTKLLTKASVAVAALSVALITPFAESIVNGWLRSDCYPGDVVFALIAGTFVVDALSCTPTLILIAMSKQKGLALLLVAKAAIAGLAAIGLAGCFSDPLIGVASGAFGASLLAAAAIPSLIRPAIGVPQQAYLDGFLLRPLLHAVATCGAVALLAGPLPPLPRLIATLLLLAASTAAVWWLVFDHEDRARLRSAINQLSPWSSGAG